MTAFEQVLIGVDFSAESELAIDQAIALAPGARFTLAHVTPTVAMVRASYGGADTVPAAVVELERHGDRLRLAELRERIAARGVEVTTLVADGSPDALLATLAEERGCDLIAVGTHGRTGVKRLLLGSIAEKTVRLARCAVLVARAGGGTRRILVPTDFSAHADAALAAAIAIVPADGSIELVHCWWTPWMAPEAPVDVASGLREAAETAGKELIERTRSPVPLRFTAVMEPPTAGVIDVARGQYDLVVMGSHGHRGFRRLLLGSVAEATVRHASCSVLVVHLPTDR